jgi:hypothetical protein
MAPSAATHYIMSKDRETDFGDISKQDNIPNRTALRPTRGMRWAKQVDAAERSLSWLIPAVTLGYIVFRILHLSVSSAPIAAGPPF